MAMVERRKVRRIATSTPERITWPATLEMARCLAEQVGNDLAKSAKHRGQDAHRLYRATQRAVLQSLVESLTNGQEAKAARSHANGTLAICFSSLSLSTPGWKSARSGRNRAAWLTMPVNDKNVTRAGREEI